MKQKANLLAMLPKSEDVSQFSAAPIHWNKYDENKRLGLSTTNITHEPPEHEKLSFMIIDAYL
jgi:hypothetical protein